MTLLLSPCHSLGWHHSGAGKVGPVQPQSLSCSASSRHMSPVLSESGQPSPGSGGAGGAGLLPLLSHRAPSSPAGPVPDA